MIRILLTLYGILLTGMVLCGPSASAQNNLPSSTLSVPVETRIAFGDSLTATLTVTVPSGDRVSEPAAESMFNNLGGRIAWRDSTAGPSVDQHRFGLTVYAFTPDTLTVGPLSVHVSGRTDTTLTSNTVILPVASVLAAADTIPLPNRAPMTISGWWLPSWVIALGILLVLVLAVVVWQFYRKRTPVEVPTVVEPINEIDVLLNIKRHAFHEHGKYKELYILLSDALRGFIHRNMSSEAMYETTTEITSALRTTSYDKPVIDALTALLTEADQVKFAKFIPPYPEVASAVDRAIEPVRAVLAENERRLHTQELAEAEASDADTAVDSVEMVQTLEGSG